MADYAASKDKGADSDAAQTVAGIFEAAGLGKVVQDKQALLALLALRNNKKYMEDIRGDMSSRTGELGVSFDLVAGTSEFKKSQAAAEASFATDSAFAKTAPALNAVFDKATDLAREFPVLTTAALSAAGALGVLAAFAGGSGLAGLLMGGAKGAAGGAIGGLIGRFAGAVGAGGAAAGAAGVLSGPALAAAAAGSYAGYEVWQLGSAVSDWYGATHRQGVTLSAESRARLAMMNGTGPDNWRGKGYRDPRMLGMTAPPGGPGSAADAIAAVGAVNLGSGALDVNVRVTDERASATTTVAKPLRLVRINAGDTNPAGYALGGAR